MACQQICPAKLLCTQGVDKELNETKELLSLQCMKNTTTGANIFSEVLKAFDKFGLDLSTLCRIATDGAQAMSGTGIRFVSLLKSPSVTI